jgi:hypothetical protein
VAKDNDLQVVQRLYEQALSVLKSRGHQEVLVYTPEDNAALHDRYQELGMTRGGTYACYWTAL